MWVEFCDWQQASYAHTVIWERILGKIYIFWHFKEASVWVIAEHSMADAFVYAIPELPVSNSLFVKLFGIICIWRIPYKTSVYSFSYCAFGAWHIRVLLYAACRKLSTQLLLTLLGTGILASILGQWKGAHSYASKLKQRQGSTQIFIQLLKVLWQPGYK